MSICRDLPPSSSKEKLRHFELETKNFELETLNLELYDMSYEKNDR